MRISIRINTHSRFWSFAYNAPVYPPFTWLHIGTDVIEGKEETRDSHIGDLLSYEMEMRARQLAAKGVEGSWHERESERAHPSTLLHVVLSVVRWYIREIYFIVYCAMLRFSHIRTRTRVARVIPSAEIALYMLKKAHVNDWKILFRNCRREKQIRYETSLNSSCNTSIPEISYLYYWNDFFFSIELHLNLIGMKKYKSSFSCMVVLFIKPIRVQSHKHEYYES